MSIEFHISSEDILDNITVLLVDLHWKLNSENNASIIKFYTYSLFGHLVHTQVLKPIT